MKMARQNYFTLFGILTVFSISIFVSCKTKITASMNHGTVMEVFDNNYGNVVLRASKDTAEYNTWINVYFPMKVNRKDDVVIVPKRYIDSLLNLTVPKILIQE